jgi:hypothetical protein
MSQYVIQAVNSNNEVVAVFKAIDFADAHVESANSVVVRFNTVLQNTTSIQAVSSISILAIDSSDGAIIVQSIYSSIQDYYNQ